MDVPELEDNSSNSTDRHLDNPNRALPPAQVWLKRADTMRETAAAGPEAAGKVDATVETSRTKLIDSDATPQPRRRLIKADLSLLLNFEDDDASDSDHSMHAADVPGSPMVEVSNGHWQKTVALDLATSGKVYVPERRHSITVCESPSGGAKASNTSTPVTNNSASQGIIQMSTNPLECLSLTLEEVKHIRSALTKAELESLLVNMDLYMDVEKGKICFRCKKTRFSFFGTWGTKCKLCMRLVCAKCSRKMRVPTEHFENIPVYALSPAPPPPTRALTQTTITMPSSGVLSDLNSSFPNSAGSAPSSPVLSKRVCNGAGKLHDSFDAHMNAAHKESGVRVSSGVESMLTLRRRKPALRSQSISRQGDINRLQGPLMNVCKDCKAMICNIIVSSRNNLTLAHRKKKSQYTVGISTRKPLAGIFSPTLTPVH